MTIGIGVLSTGEDGRINDHVPDTTILLADTMGSYGDVDSHARLHKIFMYPDARLYAVAANRIDCASELMSMLDGSIRSIPTNLQTYGKLVEAVSATCYAYKRDKFTIHEFPKMRLPPVAIDRMTASPEVQEAVQARWEKFSICCDLVIAIFDREGKAFLLQVDGEEHEIRNMLIPGFAAIGAGCNNALFWLSRRQHTLGMLPLRAGYHAYEAKLMAESSPHVNKHLDILVATAGDHWFSTTHQSLHTEKEHPEINPKKLGQLWKRYGPRDTSKLGTIV